MVVVGDAAEDEEEIDIKRAEEAKARARKVMAEKTLSEMIGHIYGRLNLLEGVERPNMFIKELQLNVEYFVKEVKKIAPAPSPKQIEYVNEFKKNLLEGIEYYRELFPRIIEETEEYRARTLAQLQEFKERLESFMAEHAAIFSKPALVAA